MSIIESKHFINGQEVRPVDADKIGIELDWTSDAQELELNVDSLKLTREARQFVLDHIDTYGVFEGIPYTFQIGSFSLEYYIDLTDNATKISGFGDSTIEVKIKKRNGMATFWENAHGLSFELLNKKVSLSLTEVKYLIVKDNQLELLIMLAISAFTLTKALAEGIERLIKSTANFLGTIFVGTGFNLGAFLSATLKFLADLAYVALLVVALIDVTKQIIELIFPPIRKLKAVTIKELMEKACGFLGFQFESNLIQNQYSALTICPVPLAKTNQSIVEKLFTLDNGSYTKGYPTARDTISTFGQLCDTLKEWFNGKFRILNGVVRFERRDFYEYDSGLQLQTTLNLQNIRENQWQYNTNEAWKRYLVSYRIDPTDFHTLDRIQSADAEYSSEPVSVLNADLVNIKGLVDIAIPFAFGIRKEKLTFIEEACLPFAKLADEVVQFFGGDSSLEAKIQGRVGVMMIGQQYYTTTKILYAISGSQPNNYLSLIGANTIYQKFHKINQIKENFKRIYTEIVPFSTAQFEQLLENNYVQDTSGNLLEILTFEWTNEGKEAEITYAQKSTEGFNTKTIAIDV
jgi:hypothetical protein